MFDPEAWAGYDDNNAKVIHQALASIAVSGLIDNQIQLLQLRVVEGFEREPAEELTRKILETRLQIGFLRRLREAGEDSLRMIER